MQVCVGVWVRVCWGVCVCWGVGVVGVGGKDMEENDDDDTLTAYTQLHMCVHHGDGMPLVGGSVNPQHVDMFSSNHAVNGLVGHQCTWKAQGAQGAVLCLGIGALLVMCLPQHGQICLCMQGWERW